MSHSSSKTPPREGVISALWTPATASGELDVSALQQSLTFLRSQPLAGIMPLGTTGEFLHLDIPQRIDLLLQVAALAGETPIIANISEMNPRLVARLAAGARTAGCVAVSLLPPWYYPITQDDLLEFLLRSADAAQLPVILYNFPERTGVRMSLETIAAFADRAPMVGIKQSGNEWDYHRDLVRLGREKNFSVFTGWDPRLAEAMSLGVAGNIGGLSNFIPEWMTGLFQAAKAGPQGAARVKEFTQRLQEVDQLCGQLSFPLNMAAGVAARGLNPGAPKQAVAPATLAKYSKLVLQLREFFEKHGLPRLA